MNDPEIATRISLFDELSTQQKLFSGAMVLLTLEATRRTVGAGLMFIVILFIIYNLYGDRLEGVLQHGEISLGHFLDINVFTTDGLFGIPKHASGCADRSGDRVRTRGHADCVSCTRTQLLAKEHANDQHRCQGHQ